MGTTELAAVETGKAGGDKSEQGEFRPALVDGPLQVYVRDWAHWRQDGATYFVTMWLADAIPERAFKEWLDLRQRWLRVQGIDWGLQRRDAMEFAERYSRVADGARQAFEREQSRMLHEELDRHHGQCLFRKEGPRREVEASLAYFHGTRWWVGDTVVMPNHVHAIVQPISKWRLEDLLSSVKRWTSRVIPQRCAAELGQVEAGQGGGESKRRFWQLESYDRILWDADELNRFRRYLQQNPAVAGVPAHECSCRPAAWLDAASGELPAGG